MHYLRWRAHGDPIFVILDRHASPEERLVARSDRSAGPDECWPWRGEIDDDGYGKLTIRKQRYMAHRLSYQIYVGPITEETIDHKCKNTRCINPRHLRPLSRVDNTMDGTGWGATNARKTHCIHGHEFTPENTRRTKEGYRTCIACSRRNRAAYDARRRAARGSAVAGVLESPQSAIPTQRRPLQADLVEELTALGQ